MPGPKRERRARTDEWASIKQWTLWPEQELYEAIRPLVLFHETAGERAKESDVPPAYAGEASRMSLKNSACKASSHLRSTAEHEKAASPFPERSAHSLLTFIM